MQFCRTQSWCLKLDVRKYFDSIDHDRLLELLTRRFKEVPLHTLFDRIVRSYRGSQGIGLPIGSLMSQHFANFYLGWLDRYVKEALQIRGYVRYMDDMLLWCDDRRELQRGRELPVGEPQQERPVEPEQQPRLPPCPEFQRTK